MINFFRKIRKQLADDNKPFKYMRYAIGEIVLVVIGILIALSINNWNEESKSEKFEKDLLIDLRNTIIGDFEITGMSIDGNERSKQSSEIILTYFDQDLPYHDTLAVHFETANIWWKMLIREQAYEKAKAYGLDFIKDDSTRKMLSELYEQNLSFSRTLDDRQSLYYYNTVTPILTDLFESLDHSWNIAETGNKPNDFELLKNDKRYRNILKTNIGNRRNYNEWIRLAVSKMKELVQRLQKEIDSGY
jgi:hypothetical protein